jgi:predicted lipoprotein with Yx(FWY)xxD motif
MRKRRWWRRHPELKPVADERGRAVALSTASLGNVSLGAVLVDVNGNSLYLFESDTTSMSTCYGSCAVTWKPLTTTDTPIALTGVMQSLRATTTRTDGTLQVTYHGHPLYYYAGDTHAGGIKGEGLQCFGGGWDIVSPAGTKVEKPGG